VLAVARGRAIGEVLGCIEKHLRVGLGCGQGRDVQTGCQSTRIWDAVSLQYDNIPTSERVSYGQRVRIELAELRSLTHWCSPLSGLQLHFPCHEHRCPILQLILWLCSSEARLKAVFSIPLVPRHAPTF
jgi:hypothetical protein